MISLPISNFTEFINIHFFSPTNKQQNWIWIWSSFPIVVSK